MHATTPLQAIKPEAAARLLDMIQMRFMSEAVHVVATLGISDLLADEPRRIEQLAEADDASAASLGRVM